MHACPPRAVVPFHGRPSLGLPVGLYLPQAGPEASAVSARQRIGGACLRHPRVLGPCTTPRTPRETEALPRGAMLCAWAATSRPDGSSLSCPAPLSSMLAFGAPGLQAPPRSLHQRPGRPFACINGPLPMPGPQRQSWPLRGGPAAVGYGRPANGGGRRCFTFTIHAPLAAAKIRHAATTLNCLGVPRRCVTRRRGSGARPRRTPFDSVTRGRGGWLGAARALASPLRH
jgi:hypothetical protein